MKTKIIAAVSLLACMPWIGGLLVLGAIVAPTVFGIVHAPESADAMTVVFRRFDRVAIASSAIVLVCEVGLATISRTLRDAVRSLSAITMSALAIYEGTILSPKIAALHAAGAIRGLGDLGVELETSHRAAELVGKIELFVGIAYVVLLVWTVAGTAVAKTSPSTPRNAPTGAKQDEGSGKLREEKA